MCVAFWCLEHPQYALILCSNRDEYLSRPTTEAHFHSFGNVKDDTSGQGSVLSGRDLLAGGTWAGISRSGRIALLTNITEPARKYSSSRGSLTSTFLLPTSPSTSFRDEIRAIVSQNAKYAGFNLLLLSPRSIGSHRNRTLAFNAAFLTNSGGGGTITARDLSSEERHCGGMSNGIDSQGAGEWPKVKQGILGLQEILNTVSEDDGESELVERLFGLLTWRSNEAIDRSTLRNTIQVDPITFQVPGSSDHVAKEYYGTRLSTVILVRRDGSTLFVERDIWTLRGEDEVKKADANGDRVFRFRIDPNTVEGADDCAEQQSIKSDSV